MTVNHGRQILLLTAGHPATRWNDKTHLSMAEEDTVFLLLVASCAPTMATRHYSSLWSLDEALNLDMTMIRRRLRWRPFFGELCTPIVNFQNIILSTFCVPIHVVSNSQCEHTSSVQMCVPKKGILLSNNFERWLNLTASITKDYSLSSKSNATFYVFNDTI